MELTPHHSSSPRNRSTRSGSKNRGRNSGRRNLNNTADTAIELLDSDADSVDSPAKAGKLGEILPLRVKCRAGSLGSAKMSDDENKKINFEFTFGPRPSISITCTLAKKKATEKAFDFPLAHTDDLEVRRIESRRKGPVTMSRSGDRVIVFF